MTTKTASDLADKATDLISQIADTAVAAARTDLADLLRTVADGTADDLTAQLATMPAPLRRLATAYAADVPSDFRSGIAFAAAIIADPRWEM